VSGVLFALVVVLPAANDVQNLHGYMGWIPFRVFNYVRPHIPHFMYHVVAPAIGLSMATSVLCAAVAVGPYRRREGWAWWALAAAGGAHVAAKAWGSLVFWPHWLDDVALPAAVWVMAVALSWRDFSMPTGRREQAP
jgi:hypothetical protein